MVNSFGQPVTIWFALFVLPIFLVTHANFSQDGIESGSLTAKTDSVWWQGWIEFFGKLLTQVFLLHLNGIWTGQVGEFSGARQS